MKFAVFNVPFALEYAAGRESLAEVIDWAIQSAVWAEEYGLDEVYFAEHHTLGVEALPSPELLIAACAQVTRRVKLGALGHLLPYHHPVTLAHQMIVLDHMTNGRYIAGVAPGAYPSDAQLFDTGRDNAEMLAESLDIIEGIFGKPGPWRLEGRYWNVDVAGFDETIAGPHLSPLQDGGPEMLMTGIQPDSPTLREAARRGYSPVSQGVHADVLRQHWETYATASAAVGGTPRRSAWRVTRDWLVADSDDQARDLALNGSLGAIAAHNIELFRSMGMIDLLTGGHVDADAVDAEWLVDNIAMVGSPETVAGRIRDLYESVGGFGLIIGPSHARHPDPETWRRSWELTGSRVAPLLADLTGEGPDGPNDDSRRNA